jgi:hypothetical protein
VQFNQAKEKFTCVIFSNKQITILQQNRIFKTVEIKKKKLNFGFLKEYLPDIAPISGELYTYPLILSYFLLSSTIIFRSD